MEYRFRRQSQRRQVRCSRRDSHGRAYLRLKWRHCLPCLLALGIKPHFFRFEEGERRGSERKLHHLIQMFSRSYLLILRIGCFLMPYTNPALGYMTRT